MEIESIFKKILYTGTKTEDQPVVGYCFSPYDGALMILIVFDRKESIIKGLYINDELRFYNPLGEILNVFIEHNILSASIRVHKDNKNILAHLEKNGFKKIKVVKQNPTQVKEQEFYIYSWKAKKS